MKDLFKAVAVCFASLGGLFIIWLTLASIILIPISFWTDRTLEFWLTYLKGQSIDVPFWLSVLTTFILNGAILIINVISEIVRLCM